MRTTARAWALASMALAGCNSPTQILVVVDTDLVPGVEISKVDASIAGPGMLSVGHSFDVLEVGVPFSFGVRPSQANDEPVRLTFAARAPDGRTLVRFAAQTRFVPGAVRVLSVPLSRACVMEPICDEAAELTCLRGECVAAEIAPSSLDAPRGDEPQPLFARPFDGGPPDAGRTDAGPTCVAGERCETGDPCSIGRTACDVAAQCEVVDVLPPGSECGAGRTCDAEGRCGPHTE